MGRHLDKIKELVSKFAKDFTPIMDDEERERQGITVAEAVWLANALLFFRTYVGTGPLSAFKGIPAPTYEDKEPSPAMKILKDYVGKLSTAVIRRAEKRQNKTTIKALQEQLAASEKELAQRDSKIGELQEELVCKNKRVAQFKRTIIELRDTALANEDASFVHVAPESEPVNELGLFYRLFKKSN